MKKIKKEKCLLFLLMLFGTICLFPKDAKAAECSASTTCGNSCTYGGVTHNTVLIGTQCWFKENLNVGTMITNFETPDNTAPTFNDPNTVQKWCFDDSVASCNSEGGLYTWAETNALPHSCNTISCAATTPNQGICPTGWHIPTDTEQHTLENYLTTPEESCDASRGGGDCSDAGTKLKLGGSSGFDALGAGNHETNGLLSFFDKREPSAHFWSSSPCLICSNYGHAYQRTLHMSLSSDMVYRSWSRMLGGISVRCLSDTVIVSPPTDKSQCKKNGWMTFNNPTFKNQGDCVSYLQSNDNAGKRNKSN